MLKQEEYDDSTATQCEGNTFEHRARTNEIITVKYKTRNHYLPASWALPSKTNFREKLRGNEFKEALPLFPHPPSPLPPPRPTPCKTNRLE